MSRRQDVTDFLDEVHKTLSDPVGGPYGWVLVPRPENKECILELGFKNTAIDETLRGLAVEDYCEGPSHDLDQPGELWVFGKYIVEKEIYIKIKLAAFGKLKRVRVISFHFARQPLLRPYGKKIEEEVEKDG